MSITFVCPDCGDRLTLLDKMAGREMPCPGCGVLIVIPAEPMLVVKAVPVVKRRVARRRQRSERAGGLPIEAYGTIATIVFDGDVIEINRNAGCLGWLIGIRGNTSLPVSSLTAVKFKTASFMAYGYIQFIFAGTLDRQIEPVNVHDDDNTVAFTQQEEQYFVELKRLVEKRMAELRAPVAQVVQPARSHIDDLEKLHQLRQQGVLTAAEFEKQKRKLLG